MSPAGWQFEGPPPGFYVPDEPVTGEPAVPGPEWQDIGYLTDGLGSTHDGGDMFVPRWATPGAHPGAPILPFGGIPVVTSTLVQEGTAYLTSPNGVLTITFHPQTDLLGLMHPVAPRPWWRRWVERICRTAARLGFALCMRWARWTLPG